MDQSFTLLPLETITYKATSAVVRKEEGEDEDEERNKEREREREGETAAAPDSQTVKCIMFTWKVTSVDELL